MRKVAPEVVLGEIKAEQKPEDRFETVLFLPEGEGRQGEGGLRTQGYFKKSETDKPLITVVTVVFNGEAHLEETILSVINQTYDNVEYIIIDGGSTDSTLNIIKEYENVINYWVSENDKGIYDAMNKGIKVSEGEWINFMNVGDLLLKIPVWHLKSNSEDLIYGNEENSGGIQKPRPLKLIEYGEMIACHQAMFFRVNKISYYKEYKIYADYHLLMEMYNKRKELLYIDEVICFYADNGISSKISTIKRKEKYKSVFMGFGLTGLVKSILYRLFKIKL